MAKKIQKRREQRQDKRQQRNQRQDRRIRQRAVRDVRTSLRPYLHEIAFQRNQTQNDAQQQLNRLGSIYGGLDTHLEDLGDDYRPQGQAITDQLQTDMGEWAQYLGDSSPAGEAAAAAGLFGNIGAGAIGELGGAQQRALDFNTSAQRQGAIEQMTTQRNTLTDLQQALDALRDRRMQAVSGIGADVRSRMDELRDFQQQMELANREFRLRQRMSEAQRQFLIDQLGFKKFR